LKLNSSIKQERERKMKQTTRKVVGLIAALGVVGAGVSIGTPASAASTR
jgi:uncharacterized protein YlxW (UPF0749 family)